MSKELLTIGHVVIEKQNFTDLKVLFFLKKCRYWESISIKTSSGEKNYKYFGTLYSDHYR